ncbi:hypothetical protein BJ138DRAFT_1151095 [Hygrophoropsis aurantiaca]|uniref:Uncharacterized protein n=1 Tax=Hygrophoropsis aurantiaca TaxID=72124 RepID=A0ACB8ADW8_9AGAM|nr:hypothetical protein BJ138DRAFT_1151095 [Hygrophoropsis aurantiaca]
MLPLPAGVPLFAGVSLSCTCTLFLLGPCRECVENIQGSFSRVIISLFLTVEWFWKVQIYKVLDVPFVLRPLNAVES